MTPFILQSKQHHYPRKEARTSTPLTPFRLWHFSEDHLLDPKLIQDLPLSDRSLSFPRWQSSLSPSCCSLPSRVGFVTLIHRYDSEFFDASWVNCTHMNGNLRVCCSQWFRKVMGGRSLAEDLVEGWELCVYSTVLIFIFPLSSCFSQRATGVLVGWLINAPDTGTIKPCSSSSLCSEWPTSKCSCPIAAPIFCKQQVKFSKELEQDMRNTFRHGPLSFCFINISPFLLR